MKKNKSAKRTRKLLIAVSTVLVIALLAILGGVGNFLVTYAIGRSGDGANRQVALKVDDAALANTSDARTKNSAIQHALTKAFYENVPEQTVSLTSSDGLKLNAAYYEQDCHKWAIVIHGYRSSHYGVLNYAQRYYDAGYQVLAPDLRACGDSEGEFVGMGWPDRLDILQWIDWILAKDTDAKIILHGISMGAATVMMTSGEATPDAVVAFVEDCGYTSVWDIFSSELKLRFHLPSIPVLNVADMIAQLRAGYSFVNASALDQVAKCEKPMLFIHGDQDNFVPYSMLQPLYDAKPGTNKQLLTVEGAGHGASAFVLGQAYWDTVFDFLTAYGM